MLHNERYSMAQVGNLEIEGVERESERGEVFYARRIIKLSIVEMHKDTKVETGSPGKKNSNMDDEVA